MPQLGVVIPVLDQYNPLGTCLLESFDKECQRDDCDSDPQIPDHGVDLRVIATYANTKRAQVGM